MKILTIFLIYSIPGGISVIFFVILLFLKESIWSLISFVLAVIYFSAGLRMIYLRKIQIRSLRYSTRSRLSFIQDRCPICDAILTSDTIKNSVIKISDDKKEDAVIKKYVLEVTCGRCSSKSTF